MTPYEQAMEQARALNPALSNPLAGPGVDKGGMREFLLRALQLGPMAIGAMPKGGPITGGKSFQMLNEMSPTVVNNPGSSTDLAMRGSLKSDLGSPQVSGAGIAENFNRPDNPFTGEVPTAKRTFGFDFAPGAIQPRSVAPPRSLNLPENANKADPRIQDILSFLDKNKVPINRVDDAAGGTSYIMAKDPTGASDIKIRFTSDDHIGNKYNKNDYGNYFDTYTGPTRGNARKPFVENKEGTKYGDDISALKDALSHRMGLNLIPEGRAPLYSSPAKTKVSQSAPMEHPELPLPNPNEAALESGGIGKYNQWNVIDSHEMEFQIQKIISQLGRELDKAPSLVLTPEIEAFSRNLKGEVQGRVHKNMEQPQLTTNEMKDLSTHINDVLRKYEFLRD